MAERGQNDPMHGYLTKVLITGTLVGFTFSHYATSATQTDTWYEQDESGNTTVHLYFFWSIHCPHCTTAKSFIDGLSVNTPWLRVHSLEVTQNRENARRFVDMATALGAEPSSVPAFLFCGAMATGFHRSETTGAALQAALADCRAHPDRFLAEVRRDPVQQTVLPDWVKVDPETAALPVTTILIAGLDAFNPCAFFVLLFLLSLMVHARSRRRMLLVGGVFVFFSGLIYFVFMAAWLNAFLLAGEIAMVTRIAGAVAAILALVNIKDYFWYRRGMTLSIPKRAKPNLYQRVRRLVGAERLSYLLAGTVVLAIAANSYELLCTAGFPMVYTRILTLRELTPGEYYGYLALYNLVYVIPLLAIVTVFALRFSKRSLSEYEGRVLKLLSGLMMLALGITLIAAPDVLSGAGGALALLVGALAVTACIVGIDRLRARRVHM